MLNIKYFIYCNLTFYDQGVIQPWGDMGPEEFSAMYISGCVVSSLASIIFRRSFKFQGNSLGAVCILLILQLIRT